MAHNHPLLTVGQYQGFYKYGSGYAAAVEDKEDEFRLFIEKINDDSFEGKAIDWDGFSANGETSVVKGFVQGNFISFTKSYPYYSWLDDNGATHIDEGIPYDVVYEGWFNYRSEEFSGGWEIRLDIYHQGEYLTIQDIFRGTWRLSLKTWD